MLGLIRRTMYRHNASKDDLVVFTQIQKAPDSSKYPHASRWYNHINNRLQDRSVSQNGMTAIRKPSILAD